jgi:hypothetical protein
MFNYSISTGKSLQKELIYMHMLKKGLPFIVIVFVILLLAAAILPADKGSQKSNAKTNTTIFAPVPVEFSEEERLYSTIFAAEKSIRLGDAAKARDYSAQVLGLATKKNDQKTSDKWQQIIETIDTGDMEKVKSML